MAGGVLPLAVLLGLGLFGAGARSQGQPAPPSVPSAPSQPAAAAAATPEAMAAQIAAHAAQARPFARVGDAVISQAEYRQALGLAMRQKYYHAQPPEGEFARFQREIGAALVDRTLLLAEARRRGLVPTAGKVEAALADQQTRLQARMPGLKLDDPSMAPMLGALRRQIEGDDLLEQLSGVVRQVGQADEAQLRAYVQRHPERFTEPEQVRLSVILLKVEPSSPQAVWDAAHEEARKLHRRLLGGADFGELAKLHSADRSAADGGRMDYLHRGMLPEALHGVVDALQPGGLSAPVQVLEGVALLRLDDRRAARARAFDEVRGRAQDLWARDESDARWAALIAGLRAVATIQIDESLYAPLASPPASSEPAPGPSRDPALQAPPRRAG